MRALARRWLVLHEEIQAHEVELERMAREKAPGLMESHGISTQTVAEMLILVGDNPERIKSEAAVRLDLSRFGAAPLIAYCAAKETNYGTNTDGRIS